MTLCFSCKSITSDPRIDAAAPISRSFESTSYVLPFCGSVSVIFDRMLEEVVYVKLIIVSLTVANCHVAVAVDKQST